MYYHPISWDSIVLNPLDLRRFVKFSPLKPNIEFFVFNKNKIFDFVKMKV